MLNCIGLEKHNMIQLKVMLIGRLVSTNFGVLVRAGAKLYKARKAQYCAPQGNVNRQTGEDVSPLILESL